MRKFITSESVTEGHPDKVCDQISDAILDECLKQDPNARVAAECITTTGLVLVVGELTTEAYVPIEDVVRDTIKEIGYIDNDLGFDYENVAVLTSINSQSPDIAQGVDKASEYDQSHDDYDKIGAGDQGMVFGYADDETEVYLPMSVKLAQDLAKRLAKVRKEKILDYLRPDGKSLVTVEYDDDILVRIDSIVISTQHKDKIPMEKIREDIIEHVIKAVVPNELIDDKTKIFVNPTGKFVIGGPKGDSGLTGRKIIVDSYGGYSKAGGGAFSGKDPGTPGSLLCSDNIFSRGVRGLIVDTARKRGRQPVHGGRLRPAHRGAELQRTPRGMGAGLTAPGGGNARGTGEINKKETAA